MNGEVCSNHNKTCKADRWAVDQHGIDLPDAAMWAVLGWGGPLYSILRGINAVTAGIVCTPRSLSAATAQSVSNNDWAKSRRTHFL